MREAGRKSSARPVRREAGRYYYEWDWRRPNSVLSRSWSPVSCQGRGPWGKEGGSEVGKHLGKCCGGGLAHTQTENCSRHYWLVLGPYRTGFQLSTQPERLHRSIGIR